MNEKNLCIVLTSAVFCVFAVGMANWFFGNPGGVKVDYNNCTQYSKEDIDSAARVVIDKFDSMEGCVLFSLRYSTDDGLEYCRGLKDDADYTECIVFDSVFRSPLTGLGAWNNNSIYTWNWHLAREAGGQWELVAWGYA